MKKWFAGLCILTAVLLLCGFQNYSVDNTAFTLVDTNELPSEH
ncbi:hypothetical protein ACFSCX_10350 [Bacillus salitolerans]|uniref:Uncharacterized protein n=1 Tax=Bacillus salitolerans TaxID=1437434 RepID=A0ABW4LSA2_9BACI